MGVIVVNYSGIEYKNINSVLHVVKISINTIKIYGNCLTIVASNPINAYL